jgi:hypothetical protein
MLSIAAVLLRRSIAPSVLAFATLLAAPARAQDPETERARTLFDEAGELERRGQWGAAQEKLRAALKIRETPHLRYALGWALENDDKLLEAKSEYETAARLALQKPGADDVGRLASARLAEVERKTPLVQIRLAGGAPPGTRLVVDGHATPLQGDVTTVPVNPGSRVVRIERSGRPATEQLVYVPRGMMRVVEIRGDETVASRTASQERHDAAGDGMLVPRDAATKDRAPVLPIVLAAGGAALAVTGGILFVSSGSDASTRDENMRQWCAATACIGGSTATLPESPEATAYRKAANDAADRGNTKQVIGATVGAIGLVGAAVGTYLLVRGDRERTSHAAALPIAAPIAGGAMAGATIRF